MPSSSAIFLLAVLATTLAPSALAQTAGNAINPAAKSIAMAATLPPYDVVSIHQNKSGAENNEYTTTDDGISFENCTLLEIVQAAYNLGNPDLISGISGPLGSARFDIQAKLAEHDTVKLTDEQLQAMVIPILANRFHLRVHVTPKPMTVYELTVAKGGPKFKLAQPDAHNGTLNSGFSGNDNTLTAKQSDMSDLADALSESQLQSIVVDRTDLKGEGNFSLKWTTDSAIQQGGADAISIFTAIQEQLGLKLQPAKLPVDTLVVDHAEMPTEN